MVKHPLVEKKHLSMKQLREVCGYFLRLLQAVLQVVRQRKDIGCHCVVGDLMENIDLNNVCM